MDPNFTPPQENAPPPAGGYFAANQMNNALWADRVLAALIDLGIAFAFMIVLYIVLWIVGFILGGIGAALDGAGGRRGGGSPVLGLLGCGWCFLLFVLPPVSYFIVGLLNKVYWVSKRGYSIGQGAMKLKVVDKDGNLIPMGTAVLRLLCQVAMGAIAIVGLLDLLWPLFDEPTRQTLHDKAVGTYVIKVQ